MFDADDDPHTGRILVQVGAQGFPGPGPHPGGGIGDVRLVGVGDRSVGADDALFDRPAQCGGDLADLPGHREADRVAEPEAVKVAEEGL